MHHILRHRLLVGGLVLAASAALTTSPPAAAAPACPGVSVTRIAAASTPLLDWSENLAFDSAGDLWVSRGQRGLVERYSRAGTRTAAVTIPEPGAIRLGPDGLIYVASGAATPNLLPGARRGTVMRINPTAAQLNPQIFARNLGMPNGMTFGPDNYLYVADSRLGLIRISPSGRLDAAWSARAPKSQSPNAVVNGVSLNGIASSGDDLFVTMTASLTGRVLRVPISDPAKITVAADLTAPTPSSLDDLIAPHPGVLVVASTAGQVLRTNLHTRQTCAVNVGQPVTALAADPRRPGRVVAGTESGDLLSLRFDGH